MGVAREGGGVAPSGWSFQWLMDEPSGPLSVSYTIHLPASPACVKITNRTTPIDISRSRPPSGFRGQRSGLGVLRHKSGVRLPCPVDGKVEALAWCLPPA